MLHYVLISIAIIVIIYFQLDFFNQNRQKLRQLKDIFPNNLHDTISTEEIEGAVVINSESESQTFTAIVTTLNDYLIENKGAASDFHLMKDVVDRNCDSVEEEISTLTPIPLYFGLIGTMFGILIGVGFLVISGGIQSLISANSTNSGSGIIELLGGVALAMISSISGILLTTIGSSLTKGAKSKLNQDKNEFLSWLQVKLLPSLSNNATSAIYALQSNLLTFNNTFSSNIQDMNEAFSTINQSHKEQLELMRLVDKMDVSQIAKANVMVLKQLQDSTSEFERFNQYLHNVSSYIDNIQKLNAGINEHLNRTQAIERMGEFFEEEITQIERRKGAINSVVGSIDDTLQKTLSNLQTNAETQLSEFIQYSVSQQNKFTKAIEEQYDQNNASILEQREVFNQAVAKQQTLLKDKLEETSHLVEELKNLGSVKDSMKNIESATSEQNRKIDDLISSIKLLTITQPGSSGGRVENIQQSSSLPKGMKIIIYVVSAIVGIAALLYIGLEIFNMISIYLGE